MCISKAKPNYLLITVVLIMSAWNFMICIVFTLCAFKKCEILKLVQDEIIKDEIIKDLPINIQCLPT